MLAWLTLSMKEGVRLIFIIYPLYLLHTENMADGSSFKDACTCEVCFDVKVNEQFFTLTNCGHHFCRDCVTMMLETNIIHSRTDLECLRCEAKVFPNDVKLIVSEEHYQKYLDFSLRRCLIQDPDARYCLAPDCPYACIIDRLHNKTDRHFICGRRECKKEFCYDCRSVWHPGKSCQQARSEVAVEVPLPSGLDAKQCPVCKVMVEKVLDGSCNQIKCLACGEDFCWLCGKKVTEMHFLRYHFISVCILHMYIHSIQSVHSWNSQCSDVLEFCGLLGAYNFSQGDNFHVVHG